MVVSYYKNHYKMKKNRLIKIKQTKGKCELCGERANCIHHLDESTDNHELDNLMVICYHCHMLYHSGPYKNTKYIRLYGATTTELAKRHRTPVSTISHWHKIGVLESIIKSGNIRSKTSKFIRLYGRTAANIGKQFNCTGPLILKWHKENTLKKALETGIRPASSRKLEKK